MYVDAMMGYIWDALVSECDYMAEGFADLLHHYVNNDGKMPPGLSRQQVNGWLSDLDLI